ncbi:MAG: hypothetical protein M3460_07820 [Actinomycetota bacterium]|nr:hypothetical protein [Actinomycetota bacterium]
MTAARARGSAVLLISVVVLVGGTPIDRIYGVGVMAVLVLSVGLMLGGLTLGGAYHQPPTWAIVVSGGLAVAALAVAPPMKYVSSNDWLLIGVLVLAAASAVPALLPLVQAEHAGRCAAAGLVLATTGYALVVLGSTPVIDVWELLQGAGHGLADGRNPYQLTFPNSPPGQINDCFTYLPATMLLTAPGVWLGGDARWAEVVLLGATGALLCWHLRARGGIRLALTLLVVLLPGSVYLVQQAWTETVLLPALVGAAVLADRGRTGWAAVAFGVALAAKQHVVLLAPLVLLLRLRPRELAAAVGTAAALTLPWLLADATRFLRCTVTLFLSVPPRQDSLSLWLLFPEPARLPLLAAALLVGYLLAWRYCPRTGGGFLVGSAVVLTMFGLINKQTFLNQWWLVGALVVAGLALAGGSHCRSPLPPSYADSMHRSTATRRRRGGAGRRHP